MRVAILSCGQSIGMFANIMPAPDVTIGVNSAVEAYPCDIWCASDHNIFRDYEPKPPFPKGVFTLGSIRRHFMETHPVTEELVKCEIPEERYRNLKAARLWNKGDYEFNGFTGFGAASPDIWKRYSVGSALMLAYLIGATEIVCFGCDMVGTKDWKGEEGRRETDRAPARWKGEREMWNLIVGWLEHRGVSVERIL